MQSLSPVLKPCPHFHVSAVSLVDADPFLSVYKREEILTSHHTGPTQTTPLALLSCARQQDTGVDTALFTELCLPQAPGMCVQPQIPLHHPPPSACPLTEDTGCTCNQGEPAVGYVKVNAAGVQGALSSRDLRNCGPGETPARELGQLAISPGALGYSAFSLFLSSFFKKKPKTI